MQVYKNSQGDLYVCVDGVVYREPAGAGGVRRTCISHRMMLHAIEFGVLTFDRTISAGVLIALKEFVKAGLIK